MSVAGPNKDEIFNTAAEMADEDQRQAYLAEVCQGDSHLRREIKELLKQDRAVGSFLETPPTGLDDTVNCPILEKPGTQIGPYKLLERIGQGGMGVVYLAEQTQPVRRRVALKIIKPGMDTQQVIKRFEAERQALALMDHPNIARVLDAGATETGRPYFVMEWVKGVPITQYCDEHQLTPRERLELFATVCQAVQHSHQKGIIHRDIKPSNVLVSESDRLPVAKVIDFGLAKAMGPQLIDKTVFTQQGQIVGTVEYKSPEQADLNPVDVDTRTDIYSLGVLLYELLIGEPPFDRTRLRSAAFNEILRIIREEEPQRPSIKLSSIESLPSIAANRHCEPKKLNTLVRGELDWIVMKALEKDRTRRYATANGLAADISHFLNDEAVSACPPSVAYRFTKFAKRNRVLFTSTAAILLCLAGGVMATIWQATRATRAMERALEAEAHARKEASRATWQSDLASQAAKTALEEKSRAESERLRAESNLSLAIEALNDLYLKGIGQERLLGYRGGPQNLTPLTPEERSLLETGLGFYVKIAGQNESSIIAQQRSARAFLSIGLLQANLSEVVAANQALLEAIARFAKLVEEDPNNATYHRQIGEAYLAMGNNHAWKPNVRDLFAEADKSFSRAIAISPEHARTYRLRGLANHSLSKPDKAAADYTRAVELEPENAQLANEAVATSPDNQPMMAARASLSVGLGEWETARQAFEEICAESDQHYPHFLHALLCLAAGKQAEYREVCSTMLQRFGETNHPLVANFVAWTACLAAGDVADFDDLVALANRAVEMEPDSDQFLNTLGAVLYRAGRHQEALQKLQELAQRLEDPDRKAESSPAYTWYFLAMTYQTTGSTEAAEQYLKKANAWTDEVLSDEANPPQWNRRLTLEILRKEAEGAVDVATHVSNGPNPNSMDEPEDNEREKPAASD